MFRTELIIAPATGQLARTARVLTMGSCFADSMGARLTANKVDTLVNPFGTVFQPLALARLLRAAAGEEVDWQQHLVEARGRWQSYDLHGSLGAESPVELLQTIQALVQRTGEFLRSADVVVLTLGTAWTYRLRETGELVSNCHKQPADLFVREMLTPDEIINALAETHAYLRRINPELRFVLTVSPVRHLKDTLQLNSVSKSVLRVATHIVSDLLPGVAYFPAYELLVDDLRDYRFYASDMLHPSEVAEDYIWDKFARTYFDAEFGRFRKEWATIRQSLGHRPLFAAAPEHRQFLESTREKLEQLSLRKVNVDAELNQVRTQLAALPALRQPAPVAEVEDDEERIDIGEGTVVSAVARPAGIAEAAEATLESALGQSLSTESRPPRLSPEEFRAQRAARAGRPERGRRDGREKGQPTVPNENEQYQVAAFAAENEAVPLVPNAVGDALVALEEVLPEPYATSLNSEAGAVGAEPVKKKKRRSRGGAKRTARKHALRLAAGELLPGAEAVAPDGTIDAAQGLGAGVGSTPVVPEKKSSVITKSVPVKRGGRRQEPGRVPRVPLFVVPTAEAVAADVPTADAELPTPVASIAPSATPATEVAVAALSVAPETVVSSSRSSRNRKKKTAKAATLGTVDASTVTLDEALPVSNSVIGTAEQLSGPVADERPQLAVPASISATPAAEGTRETTEPAANAMPPTPAARQPRRSKARAVSGARAEKPAIDTPVVPVQDPSLVRTQVAGGRLTGSSASLVEATAEPIKPVAAKKSAAAKGAAKTDILPKPASAAKAKAASGKAKPVEPASEAVPVVVEATLELAPTPPSKPTAKSKPATKAKNAPNGAPAIKAPAKAVATKAAVSKAAKNVVKPKVPTTEPAAKTPAAKAKPPKKSAKSA
ncbi:GSCFA domain-containing protein [Hymenobacter rubidus]|uniref:GSCFA domain-containing protein n=1 Tax=Hymenobacter rubidus TaxID=1441626 RepID=UPI00191FAE58|nr:GSCFA domain-containing protein [Hymenobacter rubidus]